MSCIDTPRDILEGWRQMAGLEVIPGETKAELGIRLRSSFYFWVASGEVEEPKPLAMSKECQAQLVYWGKLHQLDRLPEETDHSFLDRLLLKAKRLVPQEPEDLILDITRDFIKERL